MKFKKKINKNYKSGFTLIEILGVKNSLSELFFLIKG